MSGTIAGGRVDVGRVLELIRMHRNGRGARWIARRLGMSPNTERRYRRALDAAGLLRGDPVDLPEETCVRHALLVRLPPSRLPQQTSSIEAWLEPVAAMLRAGVTPTKIHDALRLRHRGFSGSLSAVKRMCLRIKRSPSWST